MSVGVLLITHDKVGQALLDTAVAMLGMCPLPVGVCAIRRNDERDEKTQQALRMAEQLDSGAGLLILTDAYGSTPSNIAGQLLDPAKQWRAVAGLNLPMLVRILNYPRLTVDQLVEKAVQGGREGILSWDQVPEK